MVRQACLPDRQASRIWRDGHHDKVQTGVMLSVPKHDQQKVHSPSPPFDTLRVTRSPVHLHNHRRRFNLNQVLRIDEALYLDH